MISLLKPGNFLTLIILIIGAGVAYDTISGWGEGDEDDDPVGTSLENIDKRFSRERDSFRFMEDGDEPREYLYLVGYDERPHTFSSYPGVAPALKQLFVQIHGYDGDVTALVGKHAEQPYLEVFVYADQGRHAELLPASINLRKSDEPVEVMGLLYGAGLARGTKLQRIEFVTRGSDRVWITKVTVLAVTS